MSLCYVLQDGKEGQRPRERGQRSCEKLSVAQGCVRCAIGQLLEELGMLLPSLWV
jgi:hypothetical protein